MTKTPLLGIFDAGVAELLRYLTPVRRTMLVVIVIGSVVLGEPFRDGVLRVVPILHRLTIG